MKTLYLDCGMGAAGDMLTAALLELLPEPKAFLQELNALGIPGVVTTAVRTEKCGICGTQLSVTVNGAEEESEDVPLAHTHACSHVHEHDHEHAHEHPHSHTGMADIRARIAALPVPQRVRDNILAVYGRLAAAESEAHGRPVDQIHFHEVGTMDALAAITAVCLLGETEDSAEDVLELACNLDDMTPEAIGFALERLLEAGALDAWTTPIGMKKSRPGVLLSALCRPEKRQAVLEVFLHDTTTLGVREHRCSRTALQRSVSETDSPWGPVRCKQAGGYGVSRKKYEFDDLARIARETGLSLPELLEKLP